MKELRCLNCNSTEFEYKGGIWVCNSCGSKYIPDENERPKKSEEQKLTEKLEKLIKKWTDTDYAWYLSEHSKQMDKFMMKLKEISNEILKINDANPCALTAQVLLIVFNGKWSQSESWLFIHYIDKAKDSLSPHDFLWEFLDEEFSTYKDKALGGDPSLKGTIDKLEEIFPE